MKDISNNELLIITLDFFLELKNKNFNLPTLIIPMLNTWLKFTTINVQRKNITKSKFRSYKLLNTYM
jgi:hypothetical protein